MSFSGAFGLPRCGWDAGYVRTPSTQLGPEADKPNYWILKLPEARTRGFGDALLLYLFIAQHARTHDNIAGTLHARDIVAASGHIRTAGKRGNPRCEMDYIICLDLRLIDSRVWTRVHAHTQTQTYGRRRACIRLSQPGGLCGCVCVWSVCKCVCKRVSSSSHRTHPRACGKLKLCMLRDGFPLLIIANTVCVCVWNLSDGLYILTYRVRARPTGV